MVFDMGAMEGKKEAGRSVGMTAVSALVTTNQCQGHTGIVALARPAWCASRRLPVVAFRIYGESGNAEGRL